MVSEVRYEEKEKGGPLAALCDSNDCCIPLILLLGQDLVCSTNPS